MGSTEVYIKGRVNDSNMTVDFGMPSWVEHHTGGKVQKETAECQSK